MRPHLSLLLLFPTAPALAAPNVAFAFSPPRLTVLRPGEGGPVPMEEETRRARRERWLASKHGSSASGPAPGSVGAAALVSSSSSALASGGGSERSGGSVEVRSAGRNAAGAKRKTEASSPTGLRNTVVDLTAGLADIDGGCIGDGGIDSSDDEVEIVDVGNPPRRKRRRPRAVRPKERVRVGADPDEAAAASGRVSAARTTAPSPATDPSSSPPPFLSFSAVTYNVWFGPPHQAERMSRIGSILASSEADKPTFVGMQELTPPLMSHLFPLLRNGGYELASQDISRPGEYGCAVAVLTCAVGGAEIVSSGFQPYVDTIMGRGAVWVHAKVGPSGGGRKRPEVLFCTTHLESYVPNHPVPGLAYDGAAQRQSQIREAARFCEEYASRHRRVGAAVIAGDLNWDDERKRSGGLDPPLLGVVNGGRDRGGPSSGWVDAWRECRGPDDEGYTYDARKSPMLGGNLRRRFDRCLILFPKRSGAMSPRVRDAQLIGTDPIEGLVWRKEKQRWGRGGGGRGGTGEFASLPVLPSDHYGLRVEIGEL